MTNSVLAKDDEGFLHIIDGRIIKSRAKFLKLYCRDCGAIIVTSEPDNFTFSQDDEEYYLCPGCSDNRSVNEK